MTAIQHSNADRLQKLAVAYINRSGMATADFAYRIGYAYSTVSLFLAGKYPGNDQKLADAVLAFLEKNPLEEDVVAGEIYETGAVKVMRQAFAKMLARPQVLMMYAPPGSGKTDIARHIIRQHNTQEGDNQKQFIYRIYSRAGIRPRDLMRRVAQACGCPSNVSLDRAIHNLRWDFRGCRVVLYFDEAQHLSIDCFEVVRELLDEGKNFSLCFAGSHELDRVFTKFSGTLEQLERRITDKITLPALTQEEAAGIVRSELSGIAPKLNPALIRQQIELATISVRVNKKVERYISIGRLVPALREIRESLSGQGAAEAIA